MKKLIVASLVLPLLVLVACNDNRYDELEQEAVDQQSETTEAATQAKQDLQDDLATLDREIQELQMKAQEVSADAQESLNETVTDLRDRRDGLQNDLSQLDTATEDRLDAIAGNLHERLFDLEGDVVEARLNAIEAREEFMQSVRDELNEIDRQIAQLEGELPEGGQQMSTTGAGDDSSADEMGAAGASTEQERGEAAGDVAERESGVAMEQEPDEAMEGTPDDAYEDVREQLADLRERRAALAQQYDTLEQASGDQFASMREDLAHGVAALSTDVQDALYDAEHAIEPEQPTGMQ